MLTHQRWRTSSSSRTTLAASSGWVFPRFKLNSVGPAVFSTSSPPLFTLLQQAEVPEDSDDDDPDEVFGLTTMLNLTERKVTPLASITDSLWWNYSFQSPKLCLCCFQGVHCVEEVKELILNQCEKNSTHSMTEQLEKILNDTSKPVGLLLSERFINVPPQIALPLHKHLQWVLFVHIYIYLYLLSFNTRLILTVWQQMWSINLFRRLQTNKTSLPLSAGMK